MLDEIYSYSTLVGAGLFALQLVFLFMGGGDVDADFDVPEDIGGEISGTDAGFRLLSLQGISAFILMFGLVGSAMRMDNDADPLPSLGVALLAGLGSSWVIAQIFMTFERLQSSGNLDLKNAVGATGSVYLTIEPGKTGKVSVVVCDRLVTVDATVESGSKLTSGTPVRVIRVLSDTMVIVEKAEVK